MQPMVFPKGLDSVRLTLDETLSIDVNPILAVCNSKNYDNADDHPDGPATSVYHRQQFRQQIRDLKLRGTMRLHVVLEKLMSSLRN